MSQPEACWHLAGFQRVLALMGLVCRAAGLGILELLLATNVGFAELTCTLSCTPQDCGAGWARARAEGARSEGKAQTECGPQLPLALWGGDQAAWSGVTRWPAWPTPSSPSSIPQVG